MGICSSKGSVAPDMERTSNPLSSDANTDHKIPVGDGLDMIHASPNASPQGPRGRTPGPRDAGAERAMLAAPSTLPAVSSGESVSPGRGERASPGRMPPRLTVTLNEGEAEDSHESSLTDISESMSSSPSMAGKNSLRPRAASAAFVNRGIGTSYVPFDRGEDLEQQRLQAPLSIEEDLFIYDDAVISKDEARTKHWRLAGRKAALTDPGPLLSSEDTSNGTSSSSSTSLLSTGAGVDGDGVPRRRSSTTGKNYFSFNDFDVCVDEMDMAPSSTATATAVKAMQKELLAFTLAEPGKGPSRPGTANKGSTAGGALTPGQSTVTVGAMSVTNTVPLVRNTVAALEERWAAEMPKSGRELRDFQCTPMIGHATRVKCIALSPSETNFASCSNEDASVRLANIKMQEEVGIFTQHQDTVINATFSPDGKYLATTSKDKTMILWDAMTIKPLLTFTHAKVVICCCFGPDSKYLVSGCQDRVCRLWDTRRGKEWLSFNQHEGIIIAVAYSPDGAYVCSASADKTLRVWSSTTAKARLTLTGHSGIILSCSYTADGRHIVSNDENFLKVWSTETGACTLSLSPSDIAGVTHLGPKGPKLGWTLSCAAPGAFTNYVLVACNNRFVYVIDHTTGQEVISTFCKAPVYCLTSGLKTVSACGDSFGNIYILKMS